MPAGGLPGRLLERVTGIEPASRAWKASALPLSYTRELGDHEPIIGAWGTGRVAEERHDTLHAATYDQQEWVRRPTDPAVPAGRPHPRGGLRAGKYFGPPLPGCPVRRARISGSILTVKAGAILPARTILDRYSCRTSPTVIAARCMHAGHSLACGDARPRISHGNAHARSAHGTSRRNALASTPAVDRDQAGGVRPGPAGRPGRPPLMIWCCEDNQRSDGGRRPQRRRRPCPLAGAVGRVAGPGRGSVWSGGSAAAGQGVRARPAGRPATQELLDDR